MKERKHTKELVKCFFTEDERKEIAIELAQATIDKERFEDDKKAIVSDLKSKVDTLQAKINSDATKLTNGYEMRHVDCEIEPEYISKKWIYRRVDTMEIVKEKIMTADDLQMRIDE